MTEREVLEMFLNADLSTSKEVFDIFSRLNGARHFRSSNGTEGCVYIPGSRKDRVLLVSHSDTVFRHFAGRHDVRCADGKVYFSGVPTIGIGADDRAGCAIAYLLKDLGHSILIIDGEEYGNTGAAQIYDDFPDLYDEINCHQYMLEFDRQSSSDFKVYTIPVTKEFLQFVEDNTGFKEADCFSFTDITELCGEICGANLSVGYYNEHLDNEYLVYPEWKNTLDIVRKMLAKPQPEFKIDEDLYRAFRIPYSTLVSNSIKFGDKTDYIYDRLNRRFVVKIPFAGKAV